MDSERGLTRHRRPASTPRLLRILRGAHLPCGCLVGIYETYAADVVVIVDAPDPGCRIPHHGSRRRIADAECRALSDYDGGAVCWPAAVP